jgi:hypothetical protein
MARGRMLSKSLSTSRKFRALLDEAGKRREFDQVLFTLLVAHADDFGRLEGDPFTVKALCYPSSPRPESDFAAALQAMNEVGLIVVYEIDGNFYVQVAQFDEHQVGLHKRTRSRFPDPPAVSGNFREPVGEENHASEPQGEPAASHKKSPVIRSSGNFPEIPSELNRTEGNLSFVASPPVRAKDGNGASPPFDTFWESYPGRAGRKRDRGEAEKQWVKLSLEDRGAALADVADRLERDEQWRRGFAPDAHRYLRKRGWMNDEPANTEPPYTPA